MNENRERIPACPEVTHMIEKPPDVSELTPALPLLFTRFAMTALLTTPLHSRQADARSNPAEIRRFRARQFNVFHRIGLALLVFSVPLIAQQQPNPSGTPLSNAAAAASGPQSAAWPGLSVKEKLKYDWRHLFDYDNVIFAGIGAALDQARDRPGQWGQGWGPYFGRYGSHLGQYVVQRSIMFPVQAMDHEDTRYFRSRRTSYKGRIADAFLHTVWRHDDTGGMMPAYSEFLGDYGAAAVSRLWWPKQYHTGSAIFIAGSNTVLIDAGINVFHEFTPDIKRWLHLSR